MDGYKHRKEKYAHEITLELYKKGFIQTLWNTSSKEHAEKGWEFKSKIWSPLYINLRPVGDEPELVEKIGKALSLIFINELTDCNKIVGIEMPGIPLTAAVSVAGRMLRGDEIPYLYTRPLPEKVRTLEEACLLLTRVRAGEYGEKYFLEGRLGNGDSLAFVDDVAVDFESKLIAREIIKMEMQNRHVFVRCDHALVVFDYEWDATKNAQEAGMDLHSLVPLRSKGLGWLRAEMKDEEHFILEDYLNNPGFYQDEKIRKELLREVKRSRKDISKF